MKKTIWTIIILAAIVFIILNTRSRNNFSVVDGENPIKIGAILPMTGIAAVYGEHHLNAIRMAIDEINTKGGILNRKLELVLEDNATDPKKEISGYQKLTAIDHVPVIIGGVWDIMANAVMPLVDSVKVPLISPTAPPDILDSTSQNFFTIIAPVSLHQKIIERYLRMETGQKVALMYVSSGWGNAHKLTYEKAVKETGKTIVSQSELTKFDNNDVQREITLLKTSRPDIILSAVNFIDSKLLVEKNSQLSLGAKIFSHTNLETTYFEQGIDKEALKGSVVYRLESPKSRFIEDYRKRYNKEPVSDADKAYDAIYVIAKAIEISKEVSPAGIVAGIKRISDFEGVAGPIDYTKANWPTVDNAHLEIFDGNDFVPYLDK